MVMAPEVLLSVFPNPKARRFVQIEIDKGILYSAFIYYHAK